MRRLEQTREISVTGIRSADIDLTSSGSSSYVAELLDEHDAIILGARARPTTDPLIAFQAETTMAINIAQALRLARRRPGKCVLFSSTAVYGDRESNLDIQETTPVAPSSLYGVGKYVSEMITIHATDIAQIPLVILRPCMIYGPADRSTAYGPSRFIRSIIQSSSVDVFGDGSELRDYIYAPDVAEVVLRVLANDVTGTFNLSSGHPVSFVELLRRTQSCSPSPFTINSIPRSRPKTDQIVNCSRLRSVLSDLPFTDLTTGLCNTYLSFQRETREGPHA